MNYLVTGATGFLGSRIVRSLLEDGHQVSIIKRTSSDVWRIGDLIDSIRVFDLDQGGLGAPFVGIKPYDALIHCSTCYGRKNEGLTNIYNTNVLLPLRLLEEGKKAGLSIFINTDTVLPREINFYSLSKSHLAELLKKYSYEESFHIVNVKLDHFYGPEDDKNKFTSFIILKCLSAMESVDMTRGEQLRDFVYIDDIVDAYRLILNSTKYMCNLYNEYELGTGNPVSLRCYVETVCELTKSKCKFNFGAIPYRDNEMMQCSMDVKAISELGWCPKVSLKEGILSTIEYYSHELRSK